MFTRVFKHEIKNILRDKMYSFLVIYPLILGGIAYFLVPYLHDMGGILVANIMSLIFILMTGFLFGAITGFTMLDDQDDKVLFSLKITPISVRSYIISKLILGYVFGLVATILLLLITGLLKDSSFLDLALICMLSPMQAPVVALLINAFADNKVEGFVVMKLSGVLLLVPVASLFLTNWTELFLGVLPGFWIARMVSMALIPGDYLFASPWMYFLLGVVFNTVTGLLLFKVYTRRVQI
ncbi:MAG: hypothetical protein EA375_06245 [Acholeplasmataceae bacterium]|nr:MAG: hypothetical protein EA375_06245 [Acholeplasmataceae bacterium]